MTRFLPIDRPLVYGDIVTYVTNDGEETPDRNFCLTRMADGIVSMLELATSSGSPVDKPERVFMLSTKNLRLVVEE